MRNSLPNVGDIVWVNDYGHPYKAMIIFVSEEDRQVVVERGLLRRRTVVDIHKVLGIVESVQDQAMDKVLKEQKRYG